LWSIDEGQVKRGKDQSLGLHGASGREGVAHIARVVHWGSSGMSAGSGWRREGKGIRDRWVGSACWLHDELSRRPLGRKAKQAGEVAGPTGLELKRNSFRNKNWILEFTKALKICIRRFRRNFHTMIFLNSSRILKDF
jgi:hypothetical protein